MPHKYTYHTTLCLYTLGLLTVVKRGPIKQTPVTVLVGTLGRALCTDLRTRRTDEAEILLALKLFK